MKNQPSFNQPASGIFIASVMLLFMHATDAEASSYIGIDAGSNHTLALRDDGLVFGAGDNQYGQLGIGISSSAESKKLFVPAQVKGLINIVDIAAGCNHSLALNSSGKVYSWGLNTSGQLGNGSTTNSPSAVSVKFPSGTTITAIGAGCNHSLAIDSSGYVWAWGSNSSGQIGNNSTSTSVISPVKLSLQASQVEGGKEFSLARKADGTVWSWGSNAKGQLATGSTSPSLSRIPVISKLTGIQSISAGNQHGMATTGTSVYTWGDNSKCQLGVGTSDTLAHPTPVTVKATSTYDGYPYVFAGADSSGVTFDDGIGPQCGYEFSVWGGNESSKLAAGSSATMICSPAKASNVYCLEYGGRQVGFGDSHMVTKDPLSCGLNAYGQLANGTSTAATTTTNTILP